MSDRASPRYRLRRLLGRGGMAEVFEGQAIAESGVSRRVAVKRLLASAEADRSIGRMFLDEARIASQLHHGSIVGLLDYGVVDGQPFQVLELVDGLDASELRRRGDRAGAPMSSELALYVVAEVAHALEYAHTATTEAGDVLGVVHRDVKPSNILISWSGDVKLGDFGIALARDRTERTIDGSAKGTPSYMSPEQTRGDRVDGRSDVFSLGCVLHALVVGTSPLRRDGNVSRSLAGEPLDLDPELDAEVAAIVARATHGSPEARFPTAGAMADAVGELLAKRLQATPRAALMTWLARVRVAAPERPAGRLDALLNVELLLAPSPNGEHEYVTVAPTQREPRPPSMAPRSEEDGAPPRSGPGGRRARWPWVAVAAATGALLFAGVRLVGDWGTPSLASQAVTAPPAPSGAPSETSETSETRSSDSASSGGLGVSPIVHSPTTAPSFASPPPPLASASASASASTSASRGGLRPGVLAPSARAMLAGIGTAAEAPRAVDRTVAPELPATGMIVVRGAGCVGAQIQVDGVARGLAPKMIELPVGPHVMSLRLPNGESLGSRRVVIAEANTRTAPAAWDVPAR